MTKAEIVAQISRQSGIEKTVVMTVIESFMENVKESMVAGNEVFLCWQRESTCCMILR